MLQLFLMHWNSWQKRSLKNHDIALFLIKFRNSLMTQNIFTTENTVKRDFQTFRNCLWPFFSSTPIVAVNSRAFEKIAPDIDRDDLPERGN